MSYQSKYPYHQVYTSSLRDSNTYNKQTFTSKNQYVPTQSKIKQSLGGKNEMKMGSNILQQYKLSYQYQQNPKSSSITPSNINSKSPQKRYKQQFDYQYKLKQYQQREKQYRLKQEYNNKIINNLKQQKKQLIKQYGEKLSQKQLMMKQLIINNDQKEKQILSLKSQNQKLKQSIQSNNIKPIQSPANIQPIQPQINKQLIQPQINKQPIQLPMNNFLPPKQQNQQTISMNNIIKHSQEIIRNYQNNNSNQNFKNLNQAQQKLNGVKDQLSQIFPKNNIIYQLISLTHSHLAKIYCYQSKSKEQIEKIAQKAIAIYNSKQDIFYQQKIALLNTLALYYQKSNPNEAIQTYQQILACQNRCFSAKDERTLVTLNNLACYLCENNRKGQGLKYFLKGQEFNLKSSKVSQLIQKNMNYYKIKLPNLYQNKDIFLQWLFTPKTQSISSS